MTAWDMRGPVCRRLMVIAKPPISFFGWDRFPGGFLRLNPAHRARLQQIERQNAAVQHLVVKQADIELRSQLRLCAVAQFAEFELTELVAERLGGPRNVAIRLGLDRRLIDRAGFSEEIDDLVARPAL